MDIEQVKATIARGARRADQAAVTMVRVGDDLRQAYGPAKATTHDSRHEKVVAALRDLHAAVSEAERVITLLRTSIDDAAEYAGSIG